MPFSEIVEVLGGGNVPYDRARTLGILNVNVEP
jgi:hypothetical protein